ncbi:hypothetical protein WJX72_004058 [[Myrmecia] bisecta]|uniref:Mandelate racemase/muconate lactonizing enzyme C-terminal domain-containing protein n=1 Tax=[Myrmecia] bisecta TaxID=41462 RepID=A0AAW1PAT4_9CHLO
MLLIVMLPRFTPICRHAYPRPPESQHICSGRDSTLSAAVGASALHTTRQGQVAVCQVQTLAAVPCISKAVELLKDAACKAQQRYGHYPSGLVRFEVPLPRGATALRWLQGQPKLSALQPQVYFSPRRSSAPNTAGGDAAEGAAGGSGAVAGAGAAWRWQGAAGQAISEGVVQDVQRFLSPSAPRVRALGGMRFNAEQSPSPEWREFGSYCLMIPRLEFLEADNCDLLSCTLAWSPEAAAETAQPAQQADASAALQSMAAAACPTAPSFQVLRDTLCHIPDEQGWRDMMEPVHDSLQPSATAGACQPLSPVDPGTALEEYSMNGQAGLDGLLAALDNGFQGSGGVPEGEEGLTKVVLARRSDVQFRGLLDPLALLQTLQERDPRAYQIYLQLPSGATFLGSTPEQLYARSGRSVASEAVAGTRPRGPPGDVEKDFWLAFDLLRNPKDHVEFTIVRNWVRDALAGVSERVVVDREKSVLKQGAVQHLYGRLSAMLKPDINDAALLAVLHPTPAVCGRPREAALSMLTEGEPFDRGFYAGPFAIAPEPSLGESVAETRTISLFAGVGIVQGSDAVSEWQELDLKIRQYELLLRQTPSWAAAPNVNLLWARLMVEELCRLGVNTFCVAPGSRSSPLTVAVSMHPRARIVPCIDERSLAFWALGYGRATRMPAAVITSSGTAVANLLPAVIEASQSNVPLLLLTADRPGELRDTSANQTIDQVKIFGGCTRWAVDVPPPDPAVPARMVLTTVDTAVRYATGTPAGPVHLNCQFREPLAPVQAAWPEPVLQGLDRWTSSTAPFTAPVSIPAAATLSTAATDGSLAALLGALQTTQRGLLVVGELATPADCVAAQQISSTLQWPVVADVLSGLKVGSRSTSAPAAPATLQFFDHLLLDKEAWPALRPEVVLQLGGRLTSKRTAQFLEWAALGDVSASRGACTWIFADETPQRHDAAHLLSHRMQLPLATLAQGLAQGMASEQRRRTPYGHLLTMLDETAGREISLALQEIGVLTEPHVARALSQALPPGDGLFLGNSMPIRDMDMGASGIDGVLSTAAGFAFGLDRGVTLVVGDVSFLHDINGLNLLRSGEMRPPLTVVLINNGGGGIFSFLPIADSIPEDVFTQLWTTPQNVDLAGMCRAHGIPHQKVTQQSELGPALAGAWGLNRHSVVEVVTDRTTNVDYHRQIQQAVARTTRRALKAAAPLVSASSLRLLLNSAGCPGLRVLHASYQQYSLPLQQPITTGVDDHLRKGLLVYLELSDAGGRRVRGVGEVAPLPGLHTETLLEAQRQLALLCALLHGVTIPPTLSLLQGRMAEWLDRSIGVDPTNIHPSVRCGLEGAVLSALSVAQHVQQQPGGRPEHRLSAQLSTTGGSSSSSSSEVLLINGLVSPAVDQPPAAAAQQAATLVAAGYSCLKVKVARRVDPVEDAAVLIAIRKAVGPAVALRADANRKWTLQQATDFGLAAREVRLQYLEEPCQGVHDIAEFHRQTGIPVALDETLDEALTQQPAPSHSMAAGSTQYSGGSDNLSASHAAHAPIKKSTTGPVVLFLHGFLGTADDWRPLMAALSPSCRCLAIDLPGHGQTQVTIGSSHAGLPAAHLPAELVVSVSGTAGIPSAAARDARAARDDQLARAILDGGAPAFVQEWYAQHMWKSLRRHSRFVELVEERAQTDV